MVKVFLIFCSVFRFWGFFFFNQMIHEKVVIFISPYHVENFHESQSSLQNLWGSFHAKEVVNQDSGRFVQNCLRRVSYLIVFKHQRELAYFIKATFFKY
jgi:hypothetical protein